MRTSGPNWMTNFSRYGWKNTNNINMKLLTGQEIAPSGSIGGFRFFKVVEHFNWPRQFWIYLYPAQFERDGVLSLWYRIAAKLLCPVVPTCGRTMCPVFDLFPF